MRVAAWTPRGSYGAVAPSRQGTAPTGLPPRSISSSGGGSSSAGASSSLPRPPRNTAAHAAPVRAPAAAHSERRERTLRSGDVTATSSALATSLSYKIRPDGKATVEGAGSAGPVRDFLGKLQLAWQIFFPDKPPELTPKDGAKQRLRMILVADRCGMSPSGLAEMKKNILSALEEFVDIESESQIDVSVSVEPDVGTIYCVAVPVKRVKPEAQMGFEDEVSVDGMRVVEWDPQDKESDPSSRFPMGC